MAYGKRHTIGFNTTQDRSCQDTKIQRKENPQNPENTKENVFLKNKSEAHLATKLNVIDLYSPLLHQLGPRVGSTCSQWLPSEPYDKKMRISQQKKGYTQKRQRGL